MTATKYPYRKGDRVKGLGQSNKYYLCIAVGAACRTNTATTYPVAAANVWTDASTDFANKYLADNEVKATAVAPFARREVPCLAYDSAKDSPTGTVAADTTAYDSVKAAWLCTKTGGCAKGAAPTAAGGWSLTREHCKIIADASAMTAATVEGWAYQAGVAYKGGDKVVVGGDGTKGAVGGRVYTCKKEKAEECGKVDPSGDGKAGGAEVWTYDSGKLGKSKGEPTSKSVEAIPLETWI